MRLDLPSGLAERPTFHIWTRGKRWGLVGNSTWLTCPLLRTRDTATGGNTSRRSADKASAESQAFSFRRAMRDLIQPFRSALRRLSRPGDRLVVAVSGGADSVALLDLVDRCRPALAVQLVVAHLDHGWREASAADADFVRELAASRGLPCVVERADGGPMTEAAGREARLAFFARVCAHHRAAGSCSGTPRTINVRRF